MRRFELIEGKSSKFWEVEQAGASVTVRFGRMGTQGQVQTKTLADAAAAKKEHDRLVKEKTGRGYAEVVETAGAVPLSPVPAAPSPIDWPQGGFQWTDARREQLPVVRGICVPPPVERADLLRKLLVLSDQSQQSADVELGLLGQALGRSWTAWGVAASREHITRERLEQPDGEYWLELLAQSACGVGAPLEQSGFLGYSDGVGWATRVGIALHGLPFMLEVALPLLRVRHATSRALWYRPLLSPMAAELRGAIATAPDAEHEAALAALDALAGSTPQDRLSRAYLCPHREEWALQALPDAHLDVEGWLADCVMPATQAFAYLKQRGFLSHAPTGSVLLQVQLHNEGALDLIAEALGQAQGKTSLQRWLDLAEQMQSPRMLQRLVEGLEHKEFRATLDRLARRWPAAVLKCAIEQALASRSRLGEGWAVRLALREPEARAAALAALGEDDRRRFAALLAELQIEEAPADALPPVLRHPPWLDGARAAELPTLDLAVQPVPDRVAFSEADRARHVARQPRPWVVNRLGDDPARHLQQEMQLTADGAARVMRGEPIDGDHFRLTRSYFSGESVEIVLGLPEAAGLALWNGYPSRYWHRWGDLADTIATLLARHGAKALPGLVAYVAANPEDGLAIALPVDSARLVPTALHALHHLKKAKAPAMAWLRAHASTALKTALPMAFGRTGTERDDARFAVRWFMAHGMEDEARRVAAGYGAALSKALQALLDEDPLKVLPSRIPRLPPFFEAASFRRPVLRESGAALPVAATEHLGTMLALSKADAPYAGLARVKAACTATSLAAFAWDLYEAWAAAGHPSKDNWAFLALGLLGDDETARRLAPRIREWPGEGGHQRAVTGLDLLALIGSDVALMHLNGIASKVKFKALQDRAREKIAAVAEARGFTAAELADRLVPDLGLDDGGTLVLDFGPRRFHVAFDESLKPFVKDATGERLKDLPKPVKSDDAARAEAATERYRQIKKDAKAVASLQVTRLELAMIDRRRWRADVFHRLFIEHPLMRHLAARLVWGVYGDDGVLTAAFRVAEDWTLADPHDHAFTLAPDATVGIAHVLETPAALLEAFGAVFADYEILQPFRQLGRETFSLTDAERQATQIKRYAQKTVATGSVLGLVHRGWERGAAQDAGWVSWFSKAVGDGLQVDLELDPGTIVGDLGHEPLQRLPTLTLRLTGSWGEQGQLPFVRLHPILASEVLRDIERLAPPQAA